MTELKAKLYKTAQIIEDTEGFKAGEFVSVRYVGFTPFGGMFFRVNNSAVISQCYLDNFVL